MSRTDASRVTDLVCRMSIRPEEAATNEEYEGRMFYFCSAACREKFDADRDIFARFGDGPGRPTLKQLRSNEHRRLGRDPGLRVLKAVSGELMVRCAASPR